MDFSGLSECESSFKELTNFQYCYGSFFSNSSSCEITVLVFFFLFVLDRFTILPITFEVRVSKGSNKRGFKHITSLYV